MTTNNIEELPTELIQDIFSHMDEQESIQQSRLVSRRFNDAASPYLISEAKVEMSSESLSRLEQLCNHPVFSKTITDVTISLSYYDVDMANDKSVFMEDCDTKLFQHLEILERINAFRHYSKQEVDQEEEAKREAAEKQLWALGETRELQKISEEGFSESSATPLQKLALRLHSVYKQRCDDQEEVRRDNRHIARMCDAMSKLTNLENLCFTDSQASPMPKLQESDFADLGLNRSVLEHFDFALSPSVWCGSFTTAYDTQPPVEMLGELCSQLGRSGVRPPSISMDLNAPANLRIVELSPEQQAGVRDLVSKATALRLEVDGWARKGSLAENNDRPRDEMLALCSLTRNFFSAPALESLYIFFREYPRFYETPNVSLSDILPIENKPWPQLTDLELRYQPATIEDVRTLVASQGETVTKFNWECGWLLSGRWDEAVEVLRGFNKVEDVSMEYPRGERYGEGNGGLPDIPYKKLYSYIRKETDVNPLGPDGSSGENDEDEWEDEEDESEDEN